MSESKVLEVPIDPTPEEKVEGAEVQSSAPSDSKPMSRIDELEASADKIMSDPSYDPMTGPSSLFGLYGPYLVKAVDQMSNKQLKRLIKVLVTWPLEDIKLNKNNAIEVEAYKIADRMLQSKYLMQLLVYHEEEEKRRAGMTQVSDTTSEKTDDKLETKEEVNG